MSQKSWILLASLNFFLIYCHLNVIIPYTCLQFLIFFIPPGNSLLVVISIELIIWFVEILSPSLLLFCFILFCFFPFRTLGWISLPDLELTSVVISFVYSVSLASIIEELWTVRGVMLPCFFIYIMLLNCDFHIWWYGYLPSFLCVSL
jgi:hypothetical protein